MGGIVGTPVIPGRPIPPFQLLSARGRWVRKRVSGNRSCLTGLGVEAWRCGCR
jgi:hypothetical protein